MARPLRLDYPDTYYHVLSRGNEKREIYRDQKDYLRFLEGMGKMAARFKLKIHAYVLMGNHDHLLLHTQDAILPRAIQWMGVNYSVWFNRRHGRSGHLFQGAIQELSGTRRPLLSCHVLLHSWKPPAGGHREEAVRLPVEQSYAAYADKRSQPSWLTTDLVLGIGIGEAEGTFWRSSSRLWKRNGTPWKISGMDCTWEPKSSQRSVGRGPRKRDIEKSPKPGYY